MVWLLAHVCFLTGFRNRLVVLLDWAYWIYQRHARIVTGEDAQAVPTADERPS